MVKRIGDYTLNQEIGRGQFGIVYLGEDPTGKRVAIKVIQYARLKPRDKQRVIEETQCMQKFQNSLVVQLLDTLQSANTYSLVMEYVEGGDLQQLLDINERLPEPLVKRFISQLVEALKLLHANRVIHRDLKPANILLTHKDPQLADIKIMDFGLSRNILGASMMVQSFVGSPLFMAPEVLKSDRYSFKADVWSLGVLCFEMLFSRPCFEASSLRELKILHKAPLSFPEDCGISEEAKDFLRYMLNRNSDIRPTIAELQQHPFLNDMPQLDLPSPLQELQESIIIEDPDEYEAILEKIEHHPPKYETAVLGLEQRVIEANFTVELANYYNENAKLIVALYLYRLYIEQQRSNYCEAERISSSYNMHRDDSPSFNNMYDSIQDGLISTENLVEDLDKRLLQARMNGSEIMLDLSCDVVIQEAREIMMDSAQEDPLYGCKKAYVLLESLRLAKQKTPDVNQLIDEVGEKFYLLQQAQS